MRAPLSSLLGLGPSSGQLCEPSMGRSGSACGAVGNLLHAPRCSSNMACTSVRDGQMLSLEQLEGVEHYGWQHFNAPRPGWGRVC